MIQQKLKILIPVDGSDQSFDAVTYAAGMFPFDRTEMVLFHVDAHNPDLGKSLSENPLYHEKMKTIDKWMAADHQEMNRFMEKAVEQIGAAQFPRGAVSFKIKKKEERLIDEVINESWDDYDAVVVGKTGKSRFKDKFIGSLAIKLAGKMNRIPLVIVDGIPQTDKLLLSVDRKEESFNSIYRVGTLLDVQKFHIAICHVARCSVKSKEKEDKFDCKSNHQDCPLRDVECICPSIESMKQCLEESGILSHHLTELIIEDDNPVTSVLEVSQTHQFGSVVVGRRAIVSYIEELISGRYSQKVLKKMKNMALWIVN